MAEERKNRDEEGFTLVELMIVVAIIGVLAALAIYGVSRYLKHSKTAEATRSIGTMEVGSKAKFQLDTDKSGTGIGPFVHVFCPSAGAPVPAAGIPKGQKLAVVSGAGTEYNQATFTCLKFIMTDPQFYQYNYTSNNPTDGPAALYTATAMGDLDGNGINSTFQLKGGGSSTGEAARISMTVINEDE